MPDLYLAQNVLLVPAADRVHVLTARGAASLNFRGAGRLLSLLQPSLVAGQSHRELLARCTPQSRHTVACFFDGLSEAGALTAHADRTLAAEWRRPSGLTEHGPLWLDRAADLTQAMPSPIFAPIQAALELLLGTNSALSHLDTLVAVKAEGIAPEELSPIARWLASLSSPTAAGGCRFFRLDPASGHLGLWASFDPRSRKSLRSIPDQCRWISAGEERQIPFTVLSFDRSSITGMPLYISPRHTVALEEQMLAELLAQRTQACSHFQQEPTGRRWLRMKLPIRDDSFAAPGKEISVSTSPLQAYAMQLEKAASKLETSGHHLEDVDLLDTARDHADTVYLVSLLRDRVSRLPARCYSGNWFVYENAHARCVSLIREKARQECLFQSAVALLHPRPEPPCSHRFFCGDHEQYISRAELRRLIEERSGPILAEAPDTVFQMQHHTGLGRHAWVSRS